LTNQKNELDRQLNELQRQLGDKQTKYDELKRKAKSDKEKYMEVLGQYREVLRQIKKEVRGKDQANELKHKQLISECVQAINWLFVEGKAVFDVLKTELDSRQTELDELQKKHEELKKRSRMNSKFLRTSCKMVQNARDAAQADFQVEQTAHADTHDQLTQKQADLQQEQANHQITQQQLTIQQNRNNNLQQQLATANEDITRLTNDYQQEKQRADNLKTERDNYKNKLDTHTCSISCQRSCCLGDYERLQKKLTAQRKEIF